MSEKAHQQIEESPIAKVPRIDTSHLMRLYLTGQHETLFEIFLDAFRELGAFSFGELTLQLRQILNTFLNQFLFFFTLRDVEISERQIEAFVRENALIANLLACSDIKSADVHLNLLKNHPLDDRRQFLARVLTLLSTRSSVRFDENVFFDIDPALSSLWWMHFLDGYSSSLASLNGYIQLQRHLERADSRLTFQGNVNRTVFALSYIDPDKDLAIKRKVNEWVKSRAPKIQLVSKPVPKKVAVLSGCWRDTHAVYKNQILQLEALKEDYHLTFFPLRPNQETTLFHEIDNSLLSFSLDTRSLQRGNFEIVYLPDTGMTYQSVILSNMRFAPIQITSFGHSVSSQATEIDYFIAGEGIEDRKFAEENYSERLVLTKGLGIVHRLPVESIKSREPLDDGRIVVGCAWSSQKCNFPALAQLRHIAEESRVPVLFRFLVGSGVTRMNGFLPFAESLVELFGAGSVEIITHLPYSSYLQRLQECHFLVDSFHFGGCNTIVDALFVKRPIVTRMGSKWYNRVGGAQLKAIGLEELVAEDEASFTEISLRLLQEEAFRTSVTRKIQDMNLQETILFDEKEAENFKAAIDYIRNNHSTLQKEKSRNPIILSERL